MTTQDPATYSRVRYNVVNKELDSQPNPDLRKKAKKSGVAEDVLNTVFAREMAESNDVNRAYGRVNSFIAGGFAAKLDEDLAKSCWKGYEAIGVKKKNGKTVPNCVPEDITARHASHKVIRVKDGSNFTYRKVYEEPISVAKYSVAKPAVGNAADGPDKVTKTPAHFKEVRKALAGIRESYDLNESFSAGFTLAPFARDYGITVETAFEHHPDVQEELDKIEATYKSKRKTKEN